MTAAAPPQRITRLGAYALCLDADSRVLLCRIAPGYPTAGMWTLPGGGVEFGEDPNVALLRELEEETGLQGTAGGLVGVWSRHFAPTETQSGNELHFVAIVWRVAVLVGELRVEVGGSTDAVAWFSREEAASGNVGELGRYGLSLIDAWTQ